MDDPPLMAMVHTLARSLKEREAFLYAEAALPTELCETEMVPSLVVGPIVVRNG